MKLIVERLSRPKPGEVANGDLAYCRQEEGHALFAVVDGLGHGPAAREAAEAAGQDLDVATIDTSPLAIMESLHVALRGTRGAAALVCSLSRTGRLRGCGIGNIEMRSVGTVVPARSLPGVVGSRMRRLVEFDAELTGGDRLALFSDGISSRWALRELRALSAAAACRTILETYGKPHDDATVLVVDVVD